VVRGSQGDGSGKVDALHLRKAPDIQDA
jgi:hypothetical protein